MKATNSDRWLETAQKVISDKYEYTIKLTRSSYTKGKGPCPVCRGGHDRLIVWIDGNYWCNQCHTSGYWTNVADAKRAMLDAMVAKAEEQVKLRGQMADVTDWLDYQKALWESSEYQDEWAKHGITRDDIARWGLGFCKSTPLARDYASLTFPVFIGGTLVDIRYRLIGGVDGNKYRSHLSRMIPAPYGLDSICDPETLIVVEGEKKAIICHRYGFTNVVGVPGAQITAELLDRIESMESLAFVTVAFDPGKEDDAKSLAHEVTVRGVKAATADTPLKPDDFLIRYGASLFSLILKQARPVGSITSRGANGMATYKR